MPPSDWVEYHSSSYKIIQYAGDMVLIKRTWYQPYAEVTEWVNVGEVKRDSMRITEKLKQ